MLIHCCLLLAPLFVGVDFGPCFVMLYKVSNQVFLIILLRKGELVAFLYLSSYVY